MIAARVLQGIGAAIASPTALALITTTFPAGPPAQPGVRGLRGDVGCRRGDRAHPRRRAHRDLVALDLLHQRPDRRPRRSARADLPRRVRAAARAGSTSPARSPARPGWSAWSTASPTPPRPGRGATPSRSPTWWPGSSCSPSFLVIEAAPTTPSCRSGYWPTATAPSRTSRCSRSARRCSRCSTSSASTSRSCSGTPRSSRASAFLPFSFGIVGRGAAGLVPRGPGRRTLDLGQRGDARRARDVPAVPAERGVAYVPDLLVPC